MLYIYIYIYLYIHTYTLYIHTLPPLQPWSTATSLWHHPPAAPSHIAHGCLARHSPWSAGPFLRMGVPCVQGISLGSHTNNIYVYIICIYIIIYVICYTHIISSSIVLGFQKCVFHGVIWESYPTVWQSSHKSESSPWTHVYVQTFWPKMGLPTRITHLASQDIPLDCLELHRPCNSQVSGFKLAHNLWESSTVEYF